MSAKQHKSFWVPCLSSAAGSCLTMANWQEAGVNTVSLHLDELLLKPGLAVLRQMSDLRQYMGWQGELILNASLLKEDKAGTYRLRSSYDGAVLSLDVAALFELAVSLMPDKIILPIGSAAYYDSYWHQLPETICAFWPEADSDFSKNNICYFLEHNKADDSACFIQGEIDLSQLKQLSVTRSLWIESDVPARDAVAGKVYSHAGSFNLLDPAMANAHLPLDELCQCSTCSQSLTRAYLHHLLQHTPLLAQRFLVMHNSWHVMHI